jgi:hypothetical protein
MNHSALLVPVTVYSLPVQVQLATLLDARSTAESSYTIETRMGDRLRTPLAMF